MTNRQRIIWYGAFLAAGIVAVALSIFGVIDDMLGAFGLALIIISALQLFKAARYASDPAFAKQIDVSNSDERLAYLASKSAEWTFKVSVIGLCVISLVLRLLGGGDTADVLAFVACVEITVYWVSYLVLSKKY